jgi:hypothetical protein
MVTMLWLRQVDRAPIWKTIGTWTGIQTWLIIIIKYKINFQFSIIPIPVLPYMDFYIANLATELTVVVADTFVLKPMC